MGCVAVAFAVRRHSGPSSAFRFGVDANLTDNDGDGTQTQTGSPDSDADQDNYYANYAFSIQWMRFASIRDNVTATFGVGPVVTMYRQGQRQELNAGLPAFSGYEYSTRETLYGLDLRLGAEWFFNSRVSLGGQGGLRATTGTTKYRNISRSGTGVTYSKTETDIESDATRITTGNTRILLSVYF